MSDISATLKNLKEQKWWFSSYPYLIQPHGLCKNQMGHIADEVLS